MKYTSANLQKYKSKNILKRVTQYSDNEFDIVLCSGVFEHLKKPEKAFIELNRLAKKFLIITVPNEPWFCLGNFLSGKNIARFGNPIDHINHWNCRSFKHFLQNFSVEKIKIYNCFTWIIAVIEKDEKTD